MTSHELAAALLKQPDFDVCINEYTGDSTPLRKVCVVELKTSRYRGQYILLGTRGDDWSDE